MPTNTRTKKKYTQLTESDFRRIKSLQNAGLTPAQIIAVTERSQSTISRVMNSKDFAEYKVLLNAFATKYGLGSNKVEKAKAPTTVTPENFTKTSAKVPEVSDLARIANALERLADAWEASPKRGLFK